MVRHDTHFSCLFPVASVENVEKALSLYRACAEELKRDEDADIGFLATADPDANGTSIWIHDGGGGDVEYVIAFARRCAKLLGLTGRWGFQHASTCSRPLLGCFGGGAHVLDLATGSTVGWTDTDIWLAATVAGDEPD